MSKKPLQPRQRKGRAIRNLMATAVLGAVIWHMIGSPLPGLLGFRALERRALIPPTEIILELQASEDWGHGYVGLGSDAAAAAFPEAGQLQIHPLQEDPHLIKLNAHFTMLDQEPTFGTAFVALQPPEEAKSAQLTVHHGEKIVIANALRRDDTFLFVISNSVLPDPSEIIFYELTFFDQAGEIIETVINHQ